MSLVQYSDSDSGDDDNAPVIAPKSSLKRKHSASGQHDLPPLPAAFHDLYTANARLSTADHPELHQGRKRAMPHVDGNWPSHVYLEWNPLQTESDSLHDLIHRVSDLIDAQSNQHPNNNNAVPRIIPSLQSELGAPLPLHVSLSRTLQIRTEHRDAFLDTLRSCLRKAAVHSFRFKFQGINWVPNFQRNRWFLVLTIEKPADNEFNRLLQACNEAAGKHGHPGLYIGGYGDGPMENNGEAGAHKRQKCETDEKEDVDRSERFHISIAWNLEEPKAEWIDLVKHIDVSKHINQPQASINAVKARIGNTVHSIDLKAGRGGVQ